MKKQKERNPKSEIKEKNKIIEENKSSQDLENISLIDKLIRKIERYNLKSTSFKIFTYFKMNKYKDIPIDKAYSKLVKEYDSNPNNFLTAKNVPFNSRKRFISSLSLSIKNNSFSCINRNNIKYVRINPKQALDFLNNLYNRNKKAPSEPNYPKRKTDKNNNNNNKNNTKKEVKEKNTYNNDLIGKKRKRDKNVENKEESKEIEIDLDSNEFDNKKVKIKKNENDENSNTENISNNIIFFQGVPLKKNLSSLTFNEFSDTNKNISSFYINDTITNYDTITPQNEYNIKLLFHSKEEEKIYDLLKKEIKPMSNKISIMNNILNDKQKKLLSISKLLITMDENINNYKNIKVKFIKDSNALKTCFKSIEYQIKYLKLCKKAESIPFKEEIFEKHITFIKKHLKISKNIVNENDKEITKLNTYDINFSFCKISIENEINEIIKNNSDKFSIDIIKNVIKPELIKYFKDLAYENNNIKDNYNDFKAIYEDNVQLRKVYEKYVEKIEKIETT